MKQTLRLCLLSAIFASPAIAMDCTASITALYQGGPIDPFTRGSWREETVIVAKDGSQTHSSTSTWQSPSRVKTFTNGTYIIAIGSDTWTGPSEDGPWSHIGATLPEDINAFHQATNDMLMRNLSEVSCPGTETLDGREVTKYIYRTKTDPNEYGSWFGGLHAAYIDVETNRLVRMEVRENIASWAPEPSKDAYL